MPSRTSMGGQEEPGKNVQALDRNRIGNEGFLLELMGFYPVLARQRMGFGDDQHLLIIEYRLETHAGLVQRVWGHQQVDVMAEQRESTRLNSSHVRISYAVFCLKKKKI